MTLKVQILYWHCNMKISELPDGFMTQACMPNARIGRRVGPLIPKVGFMTVPRYMVCHGIYLGLKGVARFIRSVSMYAQQYFNPLGLSSKAQISVEFRARRRSKGLLLCSSKGQH